MFRLITKFILDFCFPRYCIGCAKPGKYICRRCAGTRLTPYYAPQCHVCRHESRCELVHKDCREKTYLDGVIVSYVYGELVERLVASIKYKFYYALIGSIALLMLQNWDARILSDCVITFVPAHPYRRRWRGFNQAQLLAERLAALTGNECLSLLERSRYNSSQVGQGRSGRLESLHGAFVIKAQFRDNLPQHVVLIDDVMTTGSTVEQCARALKNVGVQCVYGMVFARGSFMT
jgi:competence protein ComFC